LETLVVTTRRIQAKVATKANQLPQWYDLLHAAPLRVTFLSEKEDFDEKRLSQTVQSSQRKPGFLGIASTSEAFTQFAPHAVARRLFGNHKLWFTLATEAFLSGFHRPAAGSDGHRAKLDAATALLTEFRADAKGVAAYFTPYIFS